jgi:hypothetical protein
MNAWPHTLQGCYYFTCGLFNDADSSSDEKALSDSMINEYGIGKDMEGSKRWLCSDYLLWAENYDHQQTTV